MLNKWEISEVMTLVFANIANCKDKLNLRRVSSTWRKKIDCRDSWVNNNWLSIDASQKDHILINSKKRSYPNSQKSQTQNNDDLEKALALFEYILQQIGPNLRSLGIKCNVESDSDRIFQAISNADLSKVSHVACFIQSRGHLKTVLALPNLKMLELGLPPYDPCRPLLSFDHDYFFENDKVHITKLVVAASCPLDILRSCCLKQIINNNCGGVLKHLEFDVPSEAPYHHFRTFLQMFEAETFSQLESLVIPLESISPESINYFTTTTKFPPKAVISAFKSMEPDVYRPYYWTPYGGPIQQLKNYFNSIQENSMEVKFRSILRESPGLNATQLQNEFTNMEQMGFIKTIANCGALIYTHTTADGRSFRVKVTH